MGHCYRQKEEWLRRPNIEKGHIVSKKVKEASTRAGEREFFQHNMHIMLCPSIFLTLAIPFVLNVILLHSLMHTWFNINVLKVYPVSPLVELLLLPDNSLFKLLPWCSFIHNSVMSLHPHLPCGGLPGLTQWPGQRGTQCLSQNELNCLIQQHSAGRIPPRKHLVHGST